jgi:WD40 repeat protein
LGNCLAKEGRSNTYLPCVKISGRKGNRAVASNVSTNESSYDVFLSYNSADHNVVENIARKLRDEGLDPFLDRWYLAAGMRWRSKLEDTLSSCKAVAIFVGPGEMGSWQQREVDVALDLQGRNPKLPVIPVLLPDCEPPLGFLRQLTWVDLRTQTLDRGIVILAKAACGEAPGPEIQKDSDSVRASICPYRGLLYFREEDAPFFFGREAVVDKLTSAVQHQPFVAVVGASGSGKSSVVRAGLVPRLRSDRRTAWETVILVPTDQPLKALARAVVPLLEPTMGEVDRLAEATRLAEHFRSGIVSLYDIVERVLAKQSGTNRVLIVVDQFEELYTLTSDDESRRCFLNELLAASSRAGSKVNITLTLRGDFVGKALAYRPLSDRLQDAQINLGPMTREELDFAIRNPAEKIQLEFEPGLVRRILNDVGDEPGNLPLLEFVLKELWDKRHGRLLLSETYDAIGGLQGAVATKADELFNGLSSAEQIVLQRVFLRIVRPSESGLDTRRRAAFTELPPEGAELVVKLANERLLVTNQSASGLEQTVEVAHEALISNWATLRAWINEDREFLLWRQRLRGFLTEWERVEKHEDTLFRGPLLTEAQKWFDQRSQDLSDQERIFITASRELRERQRRRRAVALAGAAAATLILLVVLFVMWRAAEKQTRIALSRQIAAQALADLPKNPQRSLLLAVESIAMTQADGVFVPTSASSLLHTVLAATGGLPLSGHTKRVVTTAFSPSGNWLATGSADGTARLWKRGLSGSPPIVLRPKLGNAADSSEVPQGPVLPMQAQSGTVTTLSFSADSRWLVTGSQDGPATLWDLIASPDIGRPVPLPGYRSAVNAAAFSPTGRWLATAGEDGTVRLWDLNLWDLHAVPAIAEPKRLSGHLGSRNPSLVFSGDGSRLAEWALFQNTVLVWNITADGAAAAPLSLRHDDDALAIAFSPDGSRLAVTNAYNLHLWDLTAAPVVNPLVFPKFSGWGWIETVAFSPDGHRLAAAGSSDVRLWDLTASDFASGPTLLRGHTADVRAITFSADGRWLATAGQDADARLWDLTNPASPPIVMHGHEGTINAVAIDPAGHRLATASDDHTARLWTIPDPSAEPTVLHEPGCAAGRRDCAGVGVVAFSRDGWRLASAGRDKTIRLWRLTNPVVPDMVLSGHWSDVNAVAFSPDGRWLAATYFEHSNVAWLWDLTDSASSAVPIIMGGHQKAIMAMVFSTDRRWFATGSWEGTIRVWDLAAGVPAAPRHVLTRHQAAIRGMAFSADGKRLVSVGYDPSGSEAFAIVWDMTAADPEINPIILKGHNDVVIDVAVSPPDGRWVATASWDHSARLWDMMSANPSANPVIMKFADRVSRVAFNPDGRWLAAVGWDGLTQLLDVRHPAAKPVPIWGPQAGIFATVFSPDGHWLAASSGDNSIWLWNPNDLTLEPTIMHGHTTGIAFSPDGRWLATGSPNDAATRLWSLDIKELMTTASRTAGRNLTEEEWQRFLGGQPYHKIW